MRESDDPLRVGDLLETADGHLRICKYVGFEPAEWLVAEPKTSVEPEAPVSTGVTSSNEEAHAGTTPGR
jgi:hypothetical protein